MSLAVWIRGGMKPGLANGAGRNSSRKKDIKSSVRSPVLNHITLEEVQHGTT